MAKAKHRRKRREARKASARGPAGDALRAGAADSGAPAAEGEAAGPSGRSAKPRRAARRGRAAEERPPAPWGNFPLVEIAVLIGVVLLVWGFITGGERGTVLVLSGLGMASVAGLELSVREHFGGFRSHTALLAGAAAVLTLLGLTAAGALAPEARLGAAILVFGLSAYALARWFKSRTGRAVKIR